jgi:hypothetical protein
MAYWMHEALKQGAKGPEPGRCSHRETGHRGIGGTGRAITAERCRFTVFGDNRTARWYKGRQSAGGNPLRQAQKRNCAAGRPSAMEGKPEWLYGLTPTLLS